MAKQVNKQVVGGIIVLMFIAVIALGFVFIPGLRQKDPTFHVNRAEALVQQGKLDEAAQAYALAFRIDEAKNPVNLVRAARILWRIGDLENARKFCQQALNRDSRDAQQLMFDMAFDLAMMFNAPQFWDAAAEQAEKILPADAARLAEFEKDQPDLAARAYMVRGESSLSKRGDAAAAAQGIDFFRRVVFPKPSDRTAPLDPTNIPSARRLRDIWLSMAWERINANRTDEVENLRKDAAQVVQNVINAAEKAGDPVLRARAMLLRVLPFEVTPKEAPPTWRKPVPPLIVVTDPDNKQAVTEILAQAEHLLSSAPASAPAGSQPVSEEREAADRNQVEAILTIADLWSRLSDVDKSIAVVRQGLLRHRSDPRLHQALGMLLGNQHRYDEQEAAYADALGAVPRTKGVRDILASSARAQFLDQLVGCALTRRELAKTDAEREEHLKKAQDYCSNAAREFSPDDPLVRLLRSRVLRSTGEVAAATKELEDTLKRPGIDPNLTYEIDRLLVDLYMQQQQVGPAIPLVDAMRQIRPGAWEPYFLTAQLRLQENNPREALVFLNALLESDGKNPPRFPNLAPALRLRARVYQKLKMFDQAARDVRLAGGDKNSIDDRIDQAMLEAQSNHPEQAETLLAGILQEDPDNVRALQVLMGLLVTRNRLEDIRPYLDKAIEKNPSHPLIRAWTALTDKNLSQEQRDDKLIAILKDTPDPVDRAYKLYSIYNQIASREEAKPAPSTQVVQDWDAKAQSSLDEAERLKPDGPVILDAQFTRALEKALVSKDFSAAEKYTKKAVEYKNGRGLDEAAGKFYQGRLRMARAEVLPPEDPNRTNLYLEANDLFTEGLKIYPNFASNWVFAAQAAYALDRFAEVRDRAQEALNRQPNNAIAHKMMAAACQKLGDSAGVRTHVMAAYDAGLRNDPVINQLHALFLEEDKPAEGIPRREEYARAHPDDVDNLMRLAVLYGKMSRQEDALSVLKKAQQQRADDVSINVQLATQLWRMGRVPDAAQTLESLLARTTDPVKKSRASIALAQIFEQVANTTRKKEDAEKTEQLLKQACEPRALPEPAIAYAQYLERQARIKDAMVWYKEARDLAAGNPERQKDLSREIIRLALVARDTTEADRLIDEFHSKYRDDPQILILEGTNALIKKDFDAARQIFIDQLLKHPEDPLAHWQLGQLFLLDGRPESLPRAIDHLRKAKAFANRPPGLPGFQHRIQLAKALARANLTDEALAELQLSLDEVIRPEGVLKDAVGVLDAYVDVLLSCKPPRIRDAEDLVLKLQTRIPGDPMWPVRLGELAEKRKDAAEADKQYQNALGLSTIPGQHVMLLRQMARLYEDGRQHRRVLELLENPKWKDLVKADSTLGVQLAAAHWNTGNVDAGWDEFMSVLGIPHVEQTPLLYRTLTLLMTKSIGAEPLLKRLESKAGSQPTNAGRDMLRIVLLGQLKRWDELADVARRAVEQAAKPEDKVPLLFLVASEQYMGGQYAPCAENYRKLLELQPDNVGALNNLAYCLAENLHRAAEALPYAEKAVQLQPNDMSLLDTRGWCQALAGKYDDARRSLMACVFQDSELADARFHLGMTYKLEGKDLAMARQHIRLALDLATHMGNTDLADQARKALGELGDSGESAQSR